MFIGGLAHSSASSSPGGGGLSDPVAIDEGGTNATTYTTSQVLYYNGTRFVSAPWEINGSGHLLATTDNTNDIGTSAGNRPRNIYTSGVLVGGTSVKFTGNDRARMSSPSDGNLTMEDASGTGAFTMLAWGGITSGHVGLKRSSAVLQCRLGDDSGFATFTSGYLNATPAWSGTGVATTPLLVNVTADPGPANAASKLLDLQTASTSRFYVDKSGNAVAGLSFQHVNFSTNTNGIISLGNIAQLNLNGTALQPDAVDILAQRRTTNGNTFKVYRTYTSSSTFERGTFGWHDSSSDTGTVGTTLRIGTEKGSVGGTTQAMELITGGVIRVTYGASGGETKAEGHNVTLGTTTGTKIGTATGQKLAFWDATPVVQQVLATGGGATVDNVITLLQTLGLCKQS